jgi:UDP-glucose 4-epimerase
MNVLVTGSSGLIGSEAVRYFDRIGQLLGRPIEARYEEEARVGDHICYISDMTKLRSHYPAWGLTRSLDQIVEEIARAAGAHAPS